MRLRRLLRGLYFILLPLAAGTQERVVERSHAIPRVYVLDFTQARPLSPDNDLSQFAAKMVLLRLAELRSVRVFNQAQRPPCRVEGIQATQEQGTAGKRPSTDLLPYYEVRGSIDLHEAPSARDAEAILNYELLLVKQCQPTYVFRETKAFTLPEALDTLNATANILALRVGEEIAKEEGKKEKKDRVEVYRVRGEGAGRSAEAAREKFTRVMLLRLSDTAGFQPHEASGTPPPHPDTYTVSGELNYSSSARDERTVNLTLLVQGPVGGALPLKRKTVAPEENLIEFYLESADVVIGVLKKLRDEQQAGLGSSAIQPEVLLAKARELLCVEGQTVKRDCSPQPGPALAVLDKLTQNPQTQGDIYALTGIAKSQSKEYTAAAEAFDRAFGTASEDQPTTRIQ